MNTPLRNVRTSQDLHFDKAGMAPWSLTGRGWDVFPNPVRLEPILPEHRLDEPSARTESPSPDDGRYPGLLERLLPKRRVSTRDTSLLPARRPSKTLSRTARAAGFQVVELQVGLPQTSIITPERMEQLLLNLVNRSVPTSFEIVGDNKQVVVQFAVRESDADHAEGQLKSHFTQCSVSRVDGYLKRLFESSDSKESDEREAFVVDFGLRRECLYTLQTSRSFDPDPLIGLISSLAGLKTDERFIFQALFQATRKRWDELFLNALTDADGRPRYQESKDLLAQSKQKFSRPILAVALRCCVVASNRERALQIARGLSGMLESISGSNNLIALQSDRPIPSELIESVITRLSYRTGMLLNVSELASLAHLPSASVRSPVLRRDELNTKAAPDITSGHPLVLGDNFHHGESRPVSLSKEHRTRHVHLIGSSGSGKSTLMLNLIQQDLKNGDGICVIDPHGDLIDSIIENVPDERVSDVILFDPSDAEFPIGFNILQAKTQLEKTLLSSDLVASFRRMSTSWGDVMDSVLANAILAFVESTRGGTLFELKRFLVEKDFRAEFLESVTNDGVVYFWDEEFPLLVGKPQASILIRLDTFLRQTLIRNIVCQKDNKLDFRSIMDDRKVLLIKLSQGLIGEENAHLLGTLLVSRIYQAALSRQEFRERPHFWLYIDEFHHFITPSMERILSGTRKYHLGLILAHQEFRQMQARSQEVASSVLSNCYTRICFRLGDTDAEKFAPGFSFFDTRALQNLGIGQAIARVERAEYDFNLMTSPAPAVPEHLAEIRNKSIVSGTRTRFGRPRVEVEKELKIMRKRPETSAKKTPRGEERANSVMAIARTPSAPPRNEDKHDFIPEPIRKSPEAAGEPPTTVSDIGDIVPASNSDKRSQQHQYLQALVKRIAENRNFRTTVEKPVFGGIGRIDVALENDSRKIACEISVTNGPDYEIQNLRKCLAAGFDRVVLIATDVRHLGKIRKRAQQALSPKEITKVDFLTPDEFHVWLETETSVQAEAGEKVKGFKVKVKMKPVEESDRITRKKAISEVVFGALKRLHVKTNDK